MSEIQNQIEKLKTLQESYDELADVAENQLPLLSKESTLQEESAAIQNKIDNIKLPEIDTTELAKEATLEEVKAEVQKVSSLDADILQGKIKMANAISNKGVPSVYTDSLNDMADKVNQIPQELNLGASGFEQMVVPSPVLWNIYTVAQDLMKIQTERADYLPAYMEEYIKGYGTNAFCIAEYLGITELQLLNADGYLTSDGHFYTHINGVVTHTFPSGKAETYEAETLAHTFETDKYNVWVAYFYFNAGYTFTNGEVTSPNRLAVCGICASVSIIGTNNVMNLWIIGELISLNYPTAAPWGRNVCIRNYKNHGTDAIFKEVNGLNVLSMPELESMSSGLFLADASSNSSQSYEPYHLHLPKLHTISGVCPFLSSAGSYSFNRIKKIYLPKLVNIDVPLCSTLAQPINLFSNLIEISLPILEIINITSSGGGYNNLGLIVSSHPNKNTYYSTLKRIHIPKLKKSNVVLLKWPNNTSSYQAPSLIDIEVGEYEASLNLQGWTPDNVLADAELTAQLDKNIREHIAMKVQDRKDLSALTLTLSQKIRNILTEETEAVFAAKNWNISPAKSV